MSSDNKFSGSKILLAEDEETLASGLEYNLSEEGYAVTWAEDGKKALELFHAQVFDMIILDIMLPYIDGFEVAKRIREESPHMPILMLTARTEVKDRVKGLEIGADDYLTKPFHLEELLARIRGILRRKQWYQSSSETAPVYCFGNNEVNFRNLSCRAGKKRIRLTYQEAMVLKYLIDHEGEIVSRKELLEKVWDMSPEVETRTVDNFIMRLRKYFEPNSSDPVYFKSIRGAGYMFVNNC